MWIRYTLINLDLLTSQDLYFVPTLWLLIHNGPNQLPKLSTNEATSMRKLTFLRFWLLSIFFHEKSMKIKPAELIWNFSGLFRWSCGGLLIMILRTSFNTQSKISPKKFYSTMPRIHESIIVFNKNVEEKDGQTRVRRSVSA